MSFLNTSRSWSKLKGTWAQYKKRLVPWMVLNLRNLDQSKIASVPERVSPSPRPLLSQISHVTQSEATLITDKDLVEFLKSYLPRLHYHHPTNSDGRMLEAYYLNKLATQNYLGFSVATGKSAISGIGVFVESGVIRAGTVVALYPGTIYQPHQPMLLQSVGNHFIFRCADRLLIDGKNLGISKFIFRSCALRDSFNYDLPSCDISWITQYPINPLSVGQFVNDHVGTNNVVYQECYLTLPKSRNSSEQDQLDVEFWKYLPNVWSHPRNNMSPPGMKVIPLVAVRDIHKGEELTSSYLTFIH